MYQLDLNSWDVLNGWTQLSDDTRQEYLKAYHNAGKKLLVSAFGASEWPTTAGVDPAVSANNVADFVIKWGFDGCWTAEQWLITYTRVLRQRLPSPQYIVSHAPQAPYFFAGVYSGGGYLAIHQAVGDLIDFYNVQYYNQGSASYDTCETLFYQAGAWAAGSSVFEIAAAGVPLNKIVVGKPITPQGAANTGYMDAYSLAACFPEAKAKGWNGGVMGWQYSLDPSFNWISVLSASL
ncbi:glycoside hydrolase [Rhizoclosmatium globosum]|uniref:Glycoside hydrolase n=1 Tax=Rhizoclosmatium globosum TaxID=329046 RepID=A0A1Y2CTP1_9FUNG|nr:glycoside hydrolase [Rhizoclosmatium globosum]|eukprot:ORY50409.1 glycoside hydrolase [Rhizoclosmatium globosum]